LTVKNRIRAGATAIVAIALGGLAAACGGSSTPTTATNAEGNNSLAAYTACLQRNGVTLPSRGPGQFGGERSGRPVPSGSPRPRPAGSGGGGFGGGGFGGGGFGGGGFGGGFGGGGLFGTQAPAGVDQATWDKATKACESVRPTARPSQGPGGNNSAFAAYRNCLTDHGVTFTAGGFNTADPTFVAADKACAALRPTGRPRPSATPTP
jgi:hypothetical protein